MTVDTDIDVVEKTATKIAKPVKWQVVFHNDDFTPMDFVIWILEEVFEHSREDAIAITLEIHHNGHGIAGIYGKEIAEQKRDEVIQTARHYEHPLQCTIEPMEQ